MKFSFTPILYFIVIFFFFQSCNPDNKPKFNLTENNITGLATTIKLNTDTTTIFLSDYFNDCSTITKIMAPENIIIESNKSNDTITLVNSDNYKLNPVSILKVYINSDIYDLILLKSKKIKYPFVFDDTEKKYKSVQIAGDMNAWNPANNIFNYSDGKWQTNLYLEPDNYAYRIVLDGNSIVDPQNPDSISNGMGGWNSILKIENSNSDIIPELKTVAQENNIIKLSVNDSNSKIIALFQNYEIKTSKNNNEIKIKIPEIAKTIKRTYIRVLAYNNSYSSNEVFIPLDFGKVITESSQLTRQDKETNIMYFMMVDRFYDADKNNDKPLNDPEVSPKADFHGGDISGITEKIKSGYFKELGVNCLWLSPIVKNPEGKYGLFDKDGYKSKFSAYHGYWPLYFTEIDSRFGSSDDLKQLVQTAHENNDNVILDIVAHHVHEKSPFYQQNKDKNWTTNLYLPDGTLNTEKWDEHRLTTWFDVFLPTLNLAIPEVAEIVADSTVYWLDKYDVDGFRHDATKHIPLNFWRTLTKKVKEESAKTGKTYYQVGETYGTPELISSYIGSGMLDAQFDFNVFDAILNSVIKDDVGFEDLEARLKQSMQYYGEHNLMGNMTGNQDRNRFMSLATGDVKFDEDGKLAGWSRNIEKTTEEGFEKLAMMHSLIMTLPGIPVIYYGDEIGMTGGNDPDNRRDMKFSGLTEQQSELFNTVKTLTHLRSNNPLFLFGDLKFIKVTKDLLIYSRNYFDKSAIVIINTSDEVQHIEIPVSENQKNLKSILNNEIKIENDKLIIDIKPMKFDILME
ncbi:MAG: alpha-amylase family glycosyl hydrolase [Saprospiraceae bacterium]